MNMKLCFGVLLLLVYGRCEVVEKVYTNPNNNPNNDPYPPDLYDAAVTPVSLAFYGFEVVPDVIPRPPRSLAIVRYQNGINYYLGDLIIEPQRVPIPPYVSWPSDPSKNYTVMLVDPDVPSRTNRAEGLFIHWLVVNIPGGNVRDGRTVLNFVLTIPEYRNGRHRYTVLVYQQSSTLNIGNQFGKNFNRFRFSATNFARRYNLGPPVAGNFGRVAYEDLVANLPDNNVNDEYID